MDINRAGPHVQRPASPSAAAVRGSARALEMPGQAAGLAGQALNHVTAGTHYSWQFLSQAKVPLHWQGQGLGSTRLMLLNAWGNFRQRRYACPLEPCFMPEQPAYGKWLGAVLMDFLSRPKDSSLCPGTVVHRANSHSVKIALWRKIPEHNEGIPTTTMVVSFNVIICNVSVTTTCYLISV